VYVGDILGDIMGDIIEDIQLTQTPHYTSVQWGAEINLLRST